MSAMIKKNLLKIPGSSCGLRDDYHGYDMIKVYVNDKTLCDLYVLHDYFLYYLYIF